MLGNTLEPFTNPNDIKIHHGTFSIDLVVMLLIIVVIIPYIFYNIRSFCLLYTSPSPRDGLLSRMPSSA